VYEVLVALLRAFTFSRVPIRQGVFPLS